MPPAERSPVPRRGTADPTTGAGTVSVGPPGPPTPPPGPPICSARDCRLPAAWALQWNNPKPDQEIKAIDLVYDAVTKGQYGVPALLAVTAGNRLE